MDGRQYTSVVCRANVTVGYVVFIDAFQFSFIFKSCIFFIANKYTRIK